MLVCELREPLAVRRSVALAAAVEDGVVEVEGMVGRLGADVGEAVSIARNGEVGVVVAPELPRLGADVVVDARLAKRNIDTAVDDAPLVIGVGPGFTAGVDCHAVVESLRGHHLGRVMWKGSAAADTGSPAPVGARGPERVIRAPVAAQVSWLATIGDEVREGAILGAVGDTEVRAPFDGVVRGLIAEGRLVPAGLKIGDIDPRPDPSVCWEISDKALAIGGGVVEAVLTWVRTSS